MRASKSRRRAWHAGWLVLPLLLSLAACAGEPTGVPPQSESRCVLINGQVYCAPGG